MGEVCCQLIAVVGSIRFLAVVRLWACRIDDVWLGSTLSSWEVLVAPPCVAPFSGRSQNSFFLKTGSSILISSLLRQNFM